jgi:hypothetical protein
VTNAHTIAKSWILKPRNIIFPLLTFAIPLVIRTIPEILMGQYIVGFDTMGFYVPNTLLWLHNGINLGSYLATAPLFYAIFMSIVAAGAPLLTLKIISPLLLGFLGLSIYGYAKKSLDWSALKSLLVAVLGTLYFVALRASWDQLREELGLVFLFIALMLLATPKVSSWKRHIVLSLAMLLVVLSNQLVSVIMLGVILCTVIYKLFRKEFSRSISTIVVSLPAIMLFLFIVYLSGVTQFGFLDYAINLGSALASWTGFTSYQSMLTSEGGFFLYCYLPLIPLALIGFWRFRNLQLTSWLVVSLILLLLPIAFVSPYRWVLMLTYPLAFYTTEALSRLKTIKWKRFRFTAYKLAALYLVLSTAILSFGFIFMMSEKPFVYFNPQYINAYVYQIPSSMLQNTISITDCQDTTKALEWFSDNINSSGLLLTHTVFYSWALLTLNENQVRNYGFDPPDQAAFTATQEGRTQVYIIWWINSQGWYEQPTLPSSFHEIYQTGKIAIYSYNANA